MPDGSNSEQFRTLVRAKIKSFKQLMMNDDREILLKPKKEKPQTNFYLIIIVFLISFTLLVFLFLILLLLSLTNA